MVREQTAAFLAGDWTVEPELNALRRDTVERHVEPKVMRVLLTLASRQDHVFSKEELISAVWPDTFVSDDVLTRCISILRRVTEDDPQAPHFIQTVPKRGYRLVAPLSELPNPHPLPEAATEPLPVVDPLPAEAPVIVSAGSALEPSGVPQTAPRWWRWAVPLAAVCLLALAITLRWSSHGHAASSMELSFRTLPFTSYAGEQTEPAFSPDGRSLVFVRLSEDGNSRRICIKRIGGETVSELTHGQTRDQTHDTDEQFSPAWSPDGRQIAYLSQSTAGMGLNVTPATPGGTPRRIFIPQEQSHWEQGALSWSPDGRSLIFPDHTGSSPNSSIFRLDLASLQVEPITTPPPG